MKPCRYARIYGCKFAARHARSLYIYWSISVSTLPGDVSTIQTQTCHMKPWKTHTSKPTRYTLRPGLSSEGQAEGEAQVWVKGLGFRATWRVGGLSK